MIRSEPLQIRKAAILFRCLDHQTAAVLLAQLTPSEAQAVRAALRSLGDVDTEEQADVLAELRRAAPAAAENRRGGVKFETTLLDAGANEFHRDEFLAPDARSKDADGANGAQAFAFLDDANAEQLATFLSEEQVQTVAVVLSHLAPRRAADVLAVLPSGRQAEVLERLADLGETDPESLKVVERELVAWVARQSKPPGADAHAKKRMAAIVAAAPIEIREKWMTQLRKCGGQAAKLVAESAMLNGACNDRKRKVEKPNESDIQERRPAAHAGVEGPLPFARLATGAGSPIEQQQQGKPASRLREPRCSVPAAAFAFSQLSRLDAGTLGAVVRTIDPQVLILALAGADDALVDRVAEHFPRRVGRYFRRNLRDLGPTRLSDVAAAQQQVAAAATHCIAGSDSIYAAAG